MNRVFSRYFTRWVLRRFHLAGGWVQNREQCVYLIPRWLLVVWCGWPQSICVWVCVRLHLCVCVVLGANDSWHLATISGSLISIERFGGGLVGVGVGGAQIPLYLANRCVFDLLTHSFTRARSRTRGPPFAWHMEMSISISLSARRWWQRWTHPQENIRKITNSQEETIFLKAHRRIIEMNESTGFLFSWKADNLLFWPSNRTCFSLGTNYKLSMCRCNQYD